MRPSGRIRPHHPVININITTINDCMRGQGLEWPGDGVAASSLLLAFSDLVRFCCNILNITKKKDLTGGRPLSQKQRMTAMEIEKSQQQTAVETEAAIAVGRGPQHRCSKYYVV